MRSHAGFLHSAGKGELPPDSSACPRTNGTNVKVLERRDRRSEAFEVCQIWVNVGQGVCVLCDAT